jgi:thiosulfate reductase cytochrome b subunit
VTAAIERKVIRWIHLILSIPIAGYIYGPVAQIPEAALTVRWVFFPIVILSGLWMWKGQWLKQRWKKAFT